MYTVLEASVFVALLDVDTISLKNIIYKLHEAYNMCATCVDCIPSIYIRV